MITFDNDLGFLDYERDWTSLNEVDLHLNNTEKTGLHCAKYLVDECINHNYKLPPFLVHSMNPVGKENILSLLNQFKKFQENT